MPVATTTAIALAGLAVSAGSTGMSFAQAGKQKQLQREAQEAAAQALAEAKKKLDVNFYDQMAVKKEPYELEREALLAQGQEAIQAGVESERGAAATAGRVQMAMNEGQAGIRTAMGKEMTDIEKMQLAEDSRLRDEKAKLDLAEAQGAQQAAHDAGAEAARATAQGMQGMANLAQQGLDLIPLYANTGGAMQTKEIGKMATDTYNLSQTDLQKNIASLGTVGGVDFSKVSTMNPQQYQKFMSGIDPEILKSIKDYLPNTISSFAPKGFYENKSIYNPFDLNNTNQFGLRTQ
jgi:hypothetical protein